MINQDNEKTFAGIAQNAGGRLAVLQAPVLSTADDRVASKKKKMLPAVWGASSK